MTGPGAGRERGEPEVVLFADPTAVAVAGAERIAVALAAAAAQRGVAHFAVCGGSSPIGLYRELATRHADIPWQAVHLWWVDDRYVPPDHPDSNVALVGATLLGVDGMAARGAAVPAANVHPFPIAEAIDGGHDAAWAARSYGEEILRHVPAVDGRPVFDVMLLGVGPDGHVMSVFPGSAAMAGDAPLALAVPVPAGVAPHLERVTLRAAAADDARLLLVVVPDGSKAPVVAAALEGPSDAATLPARIARRAGAVWLLTREAAAELRSA
jgi:6-phosphogluconolactonase